MASSNTMPMSCGTESVKQHIGLSSSDGLTLDTAEIPNDKSEQSDHRTSRLVVSTEASTSSHHDNNNNRHDNDGSTGIFRSRSEESPLVPKSNDHYMSEPSLSEDGTGASSSNYAPPPPPLSPINRAIHMTHSHSNTSLSSLGSPSHANNMKTTSRKKFQFSGEKPCASKKVVNRILLSPIEGQSEGESHGDEPEEGGGSSSSSSRSSVNGSGSVPDACKLSTDDFEGMRKTRNVAEPVVAVTSPPPHSSEKSTRPKLTLSMKTNYKDDPSSCLPYYELSNEDGATLDHPRYLHIGGGSSSGGVECSNDHAEDDYDDNDKNNDYNDDDDDNDYNDDDKGSSDLSYDSSSSQEEEEDVENKEEESIMQGRNGLLPHHYHDHQGNEQCHFLNRPSQSQHDAVTSYHDASTGSVNQEELEDYLLSNADSRSMDLSSMIHPHEGRSPYSPEDSFMGDMPHATNFVITTPPRITPFDGLEVEESITPKMKTKSRTSSLHGSPSSSSSSSNSGGRGGGKCVVPSESKIEPVNGPGSATTAADADTAATAIQDVRFRASRSNSMGDKRHRRKRSGDDAAAMISTGSADWVGMELHNIPLPNERDEDEEEEDDDNDHNTMEKDVFDTKNVARQRSKSRNVQVEYKSVVDNHPSTARDDDHGFFHDSHDVSETGISTRFSPRIATDLKFDVVDQFAGAPLHRNLSFGDASVSTADSSFSWISRGTSFVMKEPEPQPSYKAREQQLANESNRFLHGSSQTTYNAVSENMQSKNAKNVPRVMNQASAHIIPDFDRDIEMQQDEQKNANSKISEHSKKTKGAAISTDPVMKSQSAEGKEFPTFQCPRCNTIQREFITVSSAHKNFESPSQYIAIYFFIYMLMSLFIFGMEEGWPPLDCLYFSVITLTTTGLGDYVPTSDSAKIICSIFIYFGVSCIGLILGSMHANSLDDAAKKQAKENMINNCPNCARKQSQMSIHAPFHGEQGSRQSYAGWNNKAQNNMNANEMTSLLKLERTTYPPSSYYYTMKAPISKLNTIDETQHHVNSSINRISGTSPDTQPSASSSQSFAASFDPMGWPSHMRQDSNETPTMTNIFDPAYTSFYRKRTESDTTNTLKTEQPTSSFKTTVAPLPFHFFDDNISDIDNFDNNSQFSGWSTLSQPAAEDNDNFRPVSRIKAAKYVFLTLKQAFTNSLFVILIGSIGFYFIEKHMTVVDSFYFTTVLLTTVGYGDIVPKSPEGKLFCTVYSVIAGAVLLHQMSMISMIPLELRKRRIERSVLMQFGDQLDDAALEELTTGPLIRRLQLSGNNSEGLGHCTREMFALTMLIRLGRITEQDVRSTYAAFNKLDKDDNGLLTSQEVLLSAYERKRRKQKISIRDDTAMLPNQQRNTHGQDNYQYSGSGRQRGMSMESNYSAVTYEDADELDLKWNKHQS